MPSGHLLWTRIGLTGLLAPEVDWALSVWCSCLEAFLWRHCSCNTHATKPFPHVLSHPTPLSFNGRNVMSSWHISGRLKCWHVKLLDHSSYNAVFHGHHGPCNPCASMAFPPTHLCSLQAEQPNLRVTATMLSLSDSLGLTAVNESWSHWSLMRSTLKILIRSYSRVSSCWLSNRS